jgi:uncharacterized protein YecT (DUF1311 family)
MKLLLSVLSFFSISLPLCAQEQPPRQVTPEILAQIKKDVEKEAADYKKTLSSPDYTTAQIEFAIDTFTIEHIVSKRMEYDYSTAGMNMAMDEMTQGYDKLLNKYYNKLLKLLKPADQKVLVAAQKAWIAYRNAEGKLIGTMSKQEYSGGGSIQSNIANGRYADVVVSRAIEIFLYYDDAATNR